MPKIDASTPVVLLPAVRQGGLGIARSLGRIGVAVYAVDPGPRSPASLSRFCKGRFEWNLEAAPASESVAFLLHLANRVGGKAILIPTTDSAALFVADHAQQLRASYLFQDQKPETAHALANKASMFHVARRYGIPAPETFFPQSEAGLLAFLETAAMPVVLKCLDAGRPLRRSAPAVQIAHSRAEAQDMYSRMQDPEVPNLVLQEYIPGGDDTIWMFNGYFNRDSQCLFGGTGKKLRQCPVYTGATCLGVCLENGVVVNTTLRFMKDIGYTGILDLGYRFDARDGQYKLLDVNPRIGSTFRLFVGEDGMDVARALYLDLTGQPVPASSPRYGRKWIVEDDDLLSGIRYYRDGKLKVADWLKSFHGVEETSFLSLTDPLPAAGMAISDLRRLGAKIFRRGRRPGKAPARTGRGSLRSRVMSAVKPLMEF
jgi:predicted ATP-grasp superfamily ATP-dependent carboligase